MDALRQGSGLPTVLNAANEVAVAAFLDNRLDFYGITRLVAQACEAALRNGTAREPETIDEALEINYIIREWCMKQLLT